MTAPGGARTGSTSRAGREHGPGREHEPGGGGSTRPAAGPSVAGQVGVHARFGTAIQCVELGHVAGIESEVEDV